VPIFSSIRIRNYNQSLLRYSWTLDFVHLIFLTNLPCAKILIISIQECLLETIFRLGIHFFDIVTLQLSQTINYTPTFIKFPSSLKDPLKQCNCFVPWMSYILQFVYLPRDAWFKNCVSLLKSIKTSNYDISTALNSIAYGTGAISRNCQLILTRIYIKL